jgi:hypothetical protein
VDNLFVRPGDEVTVARMVTKLSGSTLYMVVPKTSN